jgi:peptidoglycan/LPS O-acetylase OafA/YrhL
MEKGWAAERIGDSSTEVGKANVSGGVSSKYRPEIDGLRAFAVVAVIINHFNKALLPSGYLGVDIFFVISGYVITSSLADRQSRNFLDFVTGFYERRIKRLVPALVVFVLVTSVLISVFSPDPGVALGVGRLALFGISNIRLYQTSTDYFAESAELNPFTHTWSLGVEEQFYLLFPFLIWFSGFGQQKVKGARYLFCWVGALTVASLISFIYLYQVNQPAAYFLMPSRFWEMAVGCLIFLGFQRRAKIERILEKVPPLLVLSGMVGVMVLPIDAAVPATISIVVLSAVLIACLKQTTAAYKFFTINKVVYVGLLSYSLYLWHWPVLCISRWTIGIHWWSVPIQLGVIVLMATTSYKWIESPLRRSKWFRLGWLNLSAGLATIAVAFTISRIGGVNARALYTGGVERGSDIYSEKKQWKHDRCVGHRIGIAIPSENDFKNCDLYDLRGGINDSDSVVKVFWYGNSYNEQLMPAAARIKNNTAMHMNSFAVLDCPATLEMEYVGERVRGYCSKAFKAYLAYLEKSAAEAPILVIATNTIYFTGPNEKLSYLRIKGKALTFKQARTIYARELGKISEILRKRKGFLIVTSGLPVLKSNPDVCASRWSWLNSSCSTGFNEEVDSQNRIFSSYLQSASETGKHQFLFSDLYNPFKEKVEKAGRPVFDFYSNSSHLSRNGALLLVPSLQKALLKQSQVSNKKIFEVPLSGLGQMRKQQATVPNP